METVRGGLERARRARRGRRAGRAGARARRPSARRCTATGGPASGSSRRCWRCASGRRSHEPADRRRRPRLLGPEPGPQLRGHRRAASWRGAATPRRGARERWAPSFPGTRFTADLDDLLADDALDAVVLATPVPTHGALAERVLDAGKHCFVEKPLAQSVEEAERAVAAAERVGQDADGRPPARVPPGRGQAQGDRRLRRARRHPLHLLQPAQPREAARRRERALVARRPRHLGRAAPGRRGALRALRARRGLQAARHRGRRVRLPALPVRAWPRTCTCRGWTRTRSAASRSSAPSGWRRSTTWTSSARSPSTTRASTRARAPTASTSPARGTSGAPRSATASRCGSSASTSCSACATARAPRSDGHAGLRVVRVLEGLQASLDASRRDQDAAV